MPNIKKNHSSKKTKKSTSKNSNNPNNDAISYFNIAQRLKKDRKYNEAIENYKKAIQLKPNYLEAIFYLANLLQQMGQYVNAIKFYKIAIQLNPNIPEPYFNMGNVLHAIGKFDSAINCYQIAIKIKPTFTFAYLNLGLLFEKLDRPLDAIECFQKLITRTPEFEEGYNALGLILNKLGRLEESENIFNKAIKINPNTPKFYGNLANVLQKKSEYSKSLIHYNKAIELEPRYYEAIFSRSLIYLLTGNFEKGWQDYEQRWNLPTFNMRKYSKPLWNGQQIKNKTLLVWAEQGFGDTIHFCRYLSLLKKQNKKLIFECQPQLIDLLQTLSTYDEIRPKKSVSDNEFDYHVPLLSLPAIFKTNLKSIPCSSPYLQVPGSYQQKIVNKLQFNKNLTNIGIVWSGNIKNKNDINRSCHPKYFSTLGKQENIKLYSLHLSKENEIIHNSEFNFIQDLSAHINNFADTAAIIEKLDIIISVDTAVAHLAGALAKKVLLIIPYQPEWRWMLDRNDSPWYPTMKIFRQKIFGDWQQVLDDVYKEIGKTLKK